MLSGNFTLHTNAGEIKLEAQHTEELRSELLRRLADGEFDEEASKKRWMPVSDVYKNLVGRVDVHDKTVAEVAGWNRDSAIPPYVIHTTGGDVYTAAWSVHEFRIELARELRVGGIPSFDAAPNGGRSRTVTQLNRRVGLIDWESGEFTPTDRTEEVAYWIRYGKGREFPMEANDLTALRDELAALTRSGAFLQAGGEGGDWVEVRGSDGRLERRVAAYSQEYREEVVPFTVQRRDRSSVAGMPNNQPPLRCASQDTGFLRMELRGLLDEGEFQIEEDCRMRWLPVTQGDYFVGYVDPTERQFVPEEKRTVRYRIGAGLRSGVPMAEDAVAGLRAELQARWEDLRQLVEAPSIMERGDLRHPVEAGSKREGYHVFDVRAGRIIGYVVNGGRLLLSGTDEDGLDGTSCDSCRYWRFRDEVPVRDGDTGRIETIAREGQCRRWSPHPRYGWPETMSDLWCGEYRSRTESG